MPTERQNSIALRKRIVHRFVWEMYLAKLREWRRACERRAADQDAGSETWVSGQLVRRGSPKPTDLMLRRMIRELAGTAGRSARAARDEFTDALSGKGGGRGCGRASWDNAVRALEEDR